MNIFIITGAPGTGKTTVGEHLNKRFEKSAHLQVDFFRKLIKSGYASPLDWNAEVEKQYALARKNTTQTSKNIAKAGFTVIIDDEVRQKWMAEWKKYLKDFDLKLILLNPTLETAKSRNKLREVKTVDEKIIEYLHSHLAKENTPEKGWIVIDNTNQSVEETVDEILNNIKSNDAN